MTAPFPFTLTIALNRRLWACHVVCCYRGLELLTGDFPKLVFAGDHPDPTILKDGDDYYATFSSFDYYPGLVLWHSRDLINWTRVGPTLFSHVGAVWAPDLVKHRNRYFIYFTVVGVQRTNYVIWTDDINGRWSSPVDLCISGIDPGHAINVDGQRCLFLSNGHRVRLAEDGLSVCGPMEKVYDGWSYPNEWEVETFALEGPKLLRRGGYYYMVSAQGGTAGPPTSHMVVAARASTLDGPWENSPHNPIVRTMSADERWWSKGHGTLVEGPRGEWWIVYHAYENGFRTLGRQTLMQPIEWTPDGWFRAVAPNAATKESASGVPERMTQDGTAVAPHWQLYDTADVARCRQDGDTLFVRACGTRPADCSPLAHITGDHAYEFQVQIDLDPGVTAGVLLFYSRRLYVGLGFNASDFVLHNAGDDLHHAKPEHFGSPLHLRLRNARHIVTMHYSVDGTDWQKYDRVLEVSGYHHNVAYDFLSLRPAIYAAGDGMARFRHFEYRRLP